MEPGYHPVGRHIVIALVIALAVLHQDVWFWADTTLVFGVIPIGLFYHMLFSLAAGLVWGLAVKFAWPFHIEEFAAGENGAADQDKPRS